MYVYIRSEPGLYTVGFYQPGGKWVAESDHGSAEEAAVRVHHLNGGKEDAAPDLLAALRAVEWSGGRVYGSHGPVACLTPPSTRSPARAANHPRPGTRGPASLHP